MLAASYVKFDRLLLSGGRRRGPLLGHHQVIGILNVLSEFI
jgi:hypothetical protein